MCGITGFFGNSNLKNNNQILEKMTNLLFSRGPDAFGYYFSKKKKIYLGHSRLSIIDLSNNGSQPMFSHSKNLVIVFNGEIYNFLELKNDLQKEKFIKFNGTSDTEILIEAIDHWGLSKTLKKIDGMYAFALFDIKKNILFLVRDRFGEKPLYYSLANELLIFGSEIKSILAHPLFSKKLSKDSLSEYLRLGYVGGEKTIYTKVKKVQPGSYLKIFIKSNQLIEENIFFWSVLNEIKKSKEKILNYSEQKKIEQNLTDLIFDSVKKRIVADVKVGCFLSGGIDSSLIAAVMQNSSPVKIDTFTVGVYDKRFNEANNAKNIAKYLKTNHHEIYFENKFILEIVKSLPEIYDEPFADSSQLPTILISKLLKKNKIRVALTGDGGDELFGGYNRYIWTQQIWNMLQKKSILNKFILNILNLAGPRINDYLAILFNIFLSKSKKINNLGYKIDKIFEIAPLQNQKQIYNQLISLDKNHKDILSIDFEEDNYDKFIGSIIKKLSFPEKMMVSDLTNYFRDDILVKVDRAAMSESIETRIPFLSNSIFSYAWQIPIQMKINKTEGKIILKNILNNFIPKKYTEQPKMGFAIPLDYWLRNDLKLWAEDILDLKQTKPDWIFMPSKIYKIWNDHQMHKSNNAYLLWNIIILKYWIKKNIKYYA